MFDADFSHIFNPRTINELRAGYYRFNYAAVEPAKIVDPSSVGFSISPQLSAAGLPVVNILGYFNLGFSYEGPQPRKDTNMLFQLPAYQLLPFAISLQAPKVSGLLDSSL